MSVWFKYAGDKDITPGHPGGSSLFTLPGGVSFPPAGSYNSTLYGEVYPIANGGTYFTASENTVDYPNQICDVIVKNDGSGGTYTDWATVTNIQYNANGVLADTYLSPHLGGSLEVPSGSGNVISNYDAAGWQFTHDGGGGYYATDYGIVYIAAGTLTGYYQNARTEVPDLTGNYYDNGTYYDCIHDGSGGYYVGNVQYGSYYMSGEYITNDGTYSYYWDGNGSYYAV